jgi:hypothetical protein
MVDCVFLEELEEVEAAKMCKLNMNFVSFLLETEPVLLKFF